jgi:argininosuccinate synthase
MIHTFKQQAAIKMNELIYGGFWFTPLREAITAFVDSTQRTASGKVKLKLYKGSISLAGVTSPNSLYNLETGNLFSHTEAKGFAKLYGLPVLSHTLKDQVKKDTAKTAGQTAATKDKTAKTKKAPAKKK